jgi:hypothetical protein
MIDGWFASTHPRRRVASSPTPVKRGAFSTSDCREFRGSGQVSCACRRCRGRWHAPTRIDAMVSAPRSDCRNASLRTCRYTRTRVVTVEPLRARGRSDAPVALIQRTALPCVDVRWNHHPSPPPRRPDEVADAGAVTMVMCSWSIQPGGIATYSHKNELEHHYGTAGATGVDRVEAEAAPVGRGRSPIPGELDGEQQPADAGSESTVARSVTAWCLR